MVQCFKNKFNRNLCSQQIIFIINLSSQQAVGLFIKHTNISKTKSKTKYQKIEISENDEIYVFPQWQKCYYDSQTLEKLIMLSKRGNKIVDKIRKKIVTSSQVNNNLNHSRKSLFEVTNAQRLTRYQFQIQQIIKNSNQKFYKYTQNQIKTLHLFLQLKIFSLRSKIQRMNIYSKFADKNDKEFMNIIENTYIEIHYLKNMLNYNRSQHSLTSRQYQLNLIHKPNQIDHAAIITQRKLDRFQIQIDKLKSNLENIFKVKQKITQKEVNQLMNYGDVNPESAPKQFHLVGFLMGICFISMTVVIFLKQHFQINIDTNKTYQADFPIWRGASYFVAFQWIMGFCLFFLQHSHLNYKMILNLDGKSLPKSKSLFKDAAVTTLIYLILFSLYLLQMGGRLKTGFRYFGHIMWLVEIVYYLVPLPFTYYEGKLYFLRLIFSTWLVPFAFMKSGIQFIWMSQQLVSFSQPFTDFVYTACKFNDMTSKCDTVDANLAIIIILLSYRIIINIKMIHLKGWALIPPFWGTFRAFTGIITAIISYLYRKSLSNELFILFIISAIISTSFAIYADLRGDWGLLQQNFLRKNLFFKNRIFYYFCIIVDILLRCNWTLNISPTIVSNYKLLTFYLIMIVSYLQLVRRGIWNVFWLQFWHLQNCQKFMATIDDTQQQNIIKKRYSQQLNNNNKLYLEYNLQQKNYKQVIEIRSKSQNQLVIQNIRVREDLKNQIDMFIQKQQAKIKEIQQELKYHI